jgi:hypothetical protein
MIAIAVHLVPSESDLAFVQFVTNVVSVDVVTDECRPTSKSSGLLRSESVLLPELVGASSSESGDTRVESDIPSRQRGFHRSESHFTSMKCRSSS